jgi:Zn-dependent protease
MFVYGHLGTPFGAIPLLGWGKPTPVNPLRWRNKDLANVMVSIAGILANTLIAIIAFVLLKIYLITRADQRLAASTQEPIELFLSYLLIMNVSLAVFNLLPFPPLDGSKILDTILPASMRPMLDILEQYGFIILLVLIWAGLINAIISPIIGFISYLLFLGVR